MDDDVLHAGTPDGSAMCGIVDPKHIISLSTFVLLSNGPSACRKCLAKLYLRGQKLEVSSAHGA